ncbi:MAG: DNA internalization-related competence protein ComEC/Rec2 [Burkholderiales bacterium]|nr:DNA internalization-related competence protein ComEC/Rec2 [Burkholderiales bacterium]
MRSAILGFVIGTALLQMQAALPSLVFMGLLVACALLPPVVSKFIPAFTKFSLARYTMFMVCGAAAGFAWAAALAHTALREELPSRWEGRDLTIIGTIDSLPHRFEQGVRFNFAVERALPVENDKPVVPTRLALSWYDGFRGDESSAVGDVQPGERWQLTVRLRRPHGNANPYGFDYEVWLLEQGLRATGYVRPAEKAGSGNRRLDAFVLSAGSVIERSRAWLRARILAALPDRPYAGVIVALVVGDQRAVDQSDWKVFNRTGVSHLISISGLHITMVAGLFAAAIFALWRRSFFTHMQLPLLLPAQKAAALAGAAMALAYALLAGFGVPAQRTLYMLTVVAIALWSDRLAGVSHILCFALGLVVLLDPWAVLQPGFWLSFGAVAVILYATVGRSRMRRQAAPVTHGWLATLKSASHVQYAVTVGLVPLTMLLFAQASLVSPIANAIAIPLVSFLVTPLALAGSVLPNPLSGWILQLAHSLITQLAVFLEWLSALPWSVWSAPVPAWWMFAGAMAGTIWMLAPRGLPLRWLGTLGWLPLILNAPAAPREGEMWMTAFDVGQGMALLVETSHHRLLYDTGPYYSPESDGGNRVILPYLKARGISGLDGIVVSHNDNDHSGGALSIFDEMRVGWTASSLAFESAIVRAAPNHRRCIAGQSWSWDGVRFEMLHPTAVSYDSTKWKPNARSCTLKISQGGHSILLAGDIEAVQEDELIGSQGNNLQATVLLAPHHGSGTSSTEAFLKMVKPELALFQVGYRNRFRHPKQEVYERYGNLGIRRLRSDESGAIELRFGTSVSSTEYRKTHARYWYSK